MDCAAASITGMKNLYWGGRVGIEHDGDATNTGCNFLEQTKPFAAEREFEIAETGKVATRVWYAGDELRACA